MLSSGWKEPASLAAHCAVHEALLSFMAVMSPLSSSSVAGKHIQNELRFIDCPFYFFVLSFYIYHLSIS